MKNKQTHNWVTFSNPRNGRVRVLACATCGVAKGGISDNLSCTTLAIENHHMKKMGWEIMLVVV